jgi:integrase
LEFLILTAARTGEVRGARWSEVDFKESVWTVPANRMKGGRAHEVPLSKAAVRVLQSMEPMRQGDDGFIFPGTGASGDLSVMGIAMLLRRMDVDVTVHGFRSTFRDWAGEISTFPREVAEAALAHRVGDAVELAYRRGTALEKRRLMMEAWAGWCEPPSSAKVQPIRKVQ